MEPQSDFLDFIIVKLKERLEEVGPTEVAEATGFSPQWLYMIVHRQVTRPGIDKIERLHKYLFDAPIPTVETE